MMASGALSEALCHHVNRSRHPTRIPCRRLFSTRESPIDSFEGTFDSHEAPLLHVLYLGCGLALTACQTAPSHDAGPNHAGTAGHDWRKEPHHFSVLFSGTHVIDNETAPTIGLDYEYRVSEFLGLGVVAEYAFQDVEASTYLAVADCHITPQWIIQTGPGIEVLHEEDESEFVYRLGLLYEWQRGSYTLSPQVHYDATTGHDSVVAGVALGVAF